MRARSPAAVWPLRVHDRADLGIAPGTAILVAGGDFGSGSSREQAPWAPADLGIRAIVATGFGEIFQSICRKPAWRRFRRWRRC